MLSDDEIIEVIATRMSEEVGWSEASKVFNHYGFVDLVTHLMLEKGLRDALIQAYTGEIASAMALKELKAPEPFPMRATRLNHDSIIKIPESGDDYLDWKADVATRGGT